MTIVLFYHDTLLDKIERAKKDSLVATFLCAFLSLQTVCHAERREKHRAHSSSSTGHKKWCSHPWSQCWDLGWAFFICAANGTHGSWEKEQAGPSESPQAHLYVLGREVSRLPCCWCMWTHRGRASRRTWRRHALVEKQAWHHVWWIECQNGESIPCAQEEEGNVQLQKYYDAVLFGAKKANKHLPQSYYEEMEKFLNAFKKETAAAKKGGMLDEQDADPISWVLFQNILQWALVEQSIFLWVFSLLQWHFMACSINIGCLGLHCFCVGEDNVIAKYDKHKADQTGEKVHEKHLFDNPFDPLVSLFLALEVYLSLKLAHFETTELLFQDDSNEANAGSQHYCTQLCELFTKYKDALKQYIHVNHANTHGIHKGSSTSASSGTTCPPPVSSITAHGKWSLGWVLDLYWHFAEPGDTFLGHVLAGLDPNGEELQHSCLTGNWMILCLMTESKKLWI